MSCVLLQPLMLMLQMCDETAPLQCRQLYIRFKHFWHPFNHTHYRNNYSSTLYQLLAMFKRTVQSFC